jgi:hypothetical protein
MQRSPMTRTMQRSLPLQVARVRLYSLMLPFTGTVSRALDEQHFDHRFIY